MDAPDAGDIYDGDFDVAVDDTQQPEEYFQSGLSFDNATYDNGSDGLVFNSLEISTLARLGNDIVNNSVFIDSSYVRYSGAIQSALSQVCLRFISRQEYFQLRAWWWNRFLYSIRRHDLSWCLGHVDGSELTSFDSLLAWRRQRKSDPSGYDSGHLENAYYDSGTNMLRVQFMGDIDTGMSMNQIRDNVEFMQR